MFVSAVLEDHEIHQSDVLVLECKAALTKILQAEWKVNSGENFYCAWFNTDRILNMSRIPRLGFELVTILNGKIMNREFATLDIPKTYSHLATQTR